MKPVSQIDPSTTGDCFRACLASILEADHEEIPDFCKWQGDWHSLMNDWFAKRGLCILTVQIVDGMPWNPLPGNPWAIFVGKTPSGVLHAVVGRCEGPDFAIVHDPHPNQGGIDLVESVTFIVPLDPAVFKAQLVLDKPKILKASIMPHHRVHKFRDNGR